MACQFSFRNVLSFAGKFRRAQKGATAVEFALIATPFFFLLFAMLEVAMVFFVSISMEHATMEVARTIRTGEAQQSGQSSGGFLDAVCAEMSPLVPCNGNVYIDVRTFADFGDVNVNNPINNQELDNGNFTYNAGNAGDIVIVRVFYVWKLNTPLIGTVFANLSGERRLIATTSAFRNEPFGAI
ncbi:Similar to TadZ/CpaE, associated with Flp pilus assembly [hydrothermal vent metagenome]|uniref:Similar to TadZ/CpaE, associated with Flp pilus assembly n=1 Tax=hydrothermal vent metagenome TaxID=652676 RepID=A0A3B0R752_9ZZZZ